MMNYKKIVDIACSNLYGKYRSPESDDLAERVMERAKNMENEKNNTNVRKLIEIEVPPMDEKRERRHKIAIVSGAAAAIVGIGALSAAAIAGAGIQTGNSAATGAGYHNATVAAAAETAATMAAAYTTAVYPASDYEHPAYDRCDPQSNPYYVQTNDYLEFEDGDYKVHITGYCFDTFTLELCYNIIRMTPDDDYVDTISPEELEERRKNGEIISPGRSIIKPRLADNMNDLILESRESGYASYTDEETGASYGGESFITKFLCPVQSETFDVCFTLDSVEDAPVLKYTAETKDASDRTFLQSLAEYKLCGSENCTIAVSPYELALFATYPEGSEYHDAMPGGTPMDEQYVTLYLADGRGAQAGEVESMSKLYRSEYGTLHCTYKPLPIIIDPTQIVCVQVGSTVVYGEMPEISADTTTAAEPEGLPELQGISWNNDDETLYDFGDFTLDVGYIDFDGRTLKAFFSLIFDGEIPEDALNEPWIVLADRNAEMFEPFQSIMRSVRGGIGDTQIISYSCTVTYPEYTDVADFRFLDVHSGASKLEYPYTVVLKMHLDSPGDTTSVDYLDDGSMETAVTTAAIATTATYPTTVIEAPADDWDMYNSFTFSDGCTIRSLGGISDGRVVKTKFEVTSTTEDLSDKFALASVLHPGMMNTVYRNSDGTYTAAAIYGETISDKDEELELIYSGAGSFEHGPKVRASHGSNVMMHFIELDEDLGAYGIGGKNLSGAVLSGLSLELRFSRFDDPVYNLPAVFTGSEENSYSVPTESTIDPAIRYSDGTIMKCSNTGSVWLSQNTDGTTSFWYVTSDETLSIDDRDAIVIADGFEIKVADMIPHHEWSKTHNE